MEVADFGVVYDVATRDLEAAEEDLDNEKIVYGGPPGADLTVGVQSFGEFIYKSLRLLDGDTISMVDVTSGQTLRCRELIEGSLKVSAYLREIGVQTGDVVGIISENCVEFPMIFYGTLYLGAAVSACNPHYADNELRHVLHLSRPKVIFASTSALKTVLSVTSTDCEFVEDIVSLSCGVSSGGKVLHFEDILRNRRLDMGENFLPPAVNISETAAMIQISSGTTGLPKAVVNSQENIFWTIANGRAHRPINAKSPFDRMFLLPPFCHAYGISGLITNNLLGVTIHFMPKFNPEGLLKAVERYKIEFLALLPSVWSFLSKSPLVDKYDISSVKAFFSGAASLSKEVEEGLAKRFPMTTRAQGYGMTEATVSLITRRGDVYKPGSIGSVVPGLHCKVVDPETGHLCGENEPGELCFKGKVLMVGYLRNEKATKEMIDPQGWLHTGDIGYYDEKRHFFIVDRIKELIKFNGHQVAPAELEDILLGHPAVLDAAVIGVPDQVAGELPRAFVVKRQNAPVSENELIDLVAGKVSDHKRLRGGVQFVESVPRNPSGKILRRELRKLLTLPVSKL